MARLRRIVLSAGLAALVTLAAVGCSGDDGTVTLTDPGGVQEGGSIPLGGPASGSALPDDTYERLEGSGTTSFAAYRGRPLVVNVWATWCVPCLKEMPDFETVHQEVGEQVQFVGLNSRDDLGEARKQAERTGVTYDLLYDPSATFVAEVGVVAMPSTLFVDGSGTVVHTKAGKMDAGELRSKLAELFGA